MDETTRSRPDRLTSVLRLVVAIVGIVLLLTAAGAGFLYATTPESVRHPQSAHYHFRLQVINNNTPVNFADAKFQTEFNKDQCTAALTQEPIHFHDSLDQFVHIHWDHMTGGLLLKHYGWNFIGGPGHLLGVRFDQLPQLTFVPIHGRALPQPPAAANYYVYVGDDDAYREQSWDDFLHQDLRDFFKAKSAPSNQSWINQFIPAALAHGDDDKLTKLNDVLGSVIIFAQKDRPTEAQIKDRFSRLVPLPQSSCGG